MSIKVSCACGKSLVAKDEHAGRTAKCPSCQQLLKIPAVVTSATVTIEQTAPTSNQNSFDFGSAMDDPSQTAMEPCPGCHVPLAADKVLCPACGYSRRLKRKLPQQDLAAMQAAAPTPAPKAKPAKVKAAKPKRKKPIFSIDGGKMLGGLAMMGGAALWFGLGLLAGRIFFYPPILFIMGAFAVINGFFGEDGTW